MGASVSFFGLFTPSSRKSRSFRRRSRRRLELTPQCERLEIKIAPATFTWTGLSGGPNWSTISNWTVAGTIPSSAPSNGDSLVFPTNVSNVSTSDNLASGLTLASIQIASPGYTISPQGTRTLILSGGLSYTATSGYSTYSINTTYTGSDPISVSGGGSLYLENSTTLGAASTIEVGSSGALFVEFGIGETGGHQSLTESGSGLLAVYADSTYSGSTTITGGTMEVDATLASPSVYVQAGATLSGDGTVGAVTSTGGTISPAYGAPYPPLSPCTLTVASLSLDSNSTVNILVQRPPDVDGVRQDSVFGVIHSTH